MIPIKYCVVFFIFISPNLSFLRFSPPSSMYFFNFIYIIKLCAALFTHWKFPAKSAGEGGESGISLIHIPSSPPLFLLFWQVPYSPFCFTFGFAKFPFDFASIFSPNKGKKNWTILMRKWRGKRGKQKAKSDKLCRSAATVHNASAFSFN